MISIRALRRPLAALTGLLLSGTGLALVPQAIAPTVAHAAPTGYVTVSDGTSIAVNVRMPTNYVAGQRYPTIFEMSGYDGGSADDGTLMNDFGLVPVAEQLPGGSPLPTDDSRQLTDRFNGEYVTVHASVRGTGCSSGEFDIFSTRSALDGKEIIDGWIAEQPWSNGDVGIVGHSYGGITGFMVAATQPQHLRAMSVSGLIDDLYRGLVYPGGVTNYGFPLALDARRAPRVRRRRRPAARHRAARERRRLPHPPGAVRGRTWRSRAAPSRTTRCSRVSPTPTTTGTAPARC